MNIVEAIKNMFLSKKRERTKYRFPVISELDKIVPEYGVYGYSIADQIIDQFNSLKTPLDGHFVKGDLVSNEPSHRILSLSKSTHYLFVEIIFHENEQGKDALSNIYNIKAEIEGHYERKSNSISLQTINLKLK